MLTNEIEEVKATGLRPRLGAIDLRLGIYESRPLHRPLTMRRQGLVHFPSSQQCPAAHKKCPADDLDSVILCPADDRISNMQCLHVASLAIRVYKRMVPRYAI